MMKQSFKLSYCDYIANIIQKSLMQFDQENLLDKIGRIRLDLDSEGVFQTTVKTIDIVDMQGKAYRVTVQEL
jgi:hypothetical protein